MEGGPGLKGAEDTDDRSVQLDVFLVRGGPRGGWKDVGVVAVVVVRARRVFKGCPPVL